MRFILGNCFQRRAEPINAVRDCHDYRASARLGAERRLAEMMAEQPKQTGGGEAPLVSCHRLCHPIIRDGDGSRMVPEASPSRVSTPTLARFCRWVRDAGFRVYAPILFGSPDAGNAEANAAAYPALCVSREFTLLAANKSSPVTDWLRALGVLPIRKAVPAASEL